MAIKDGGPAFAQHPGVLMPEMGADPRWLGMSLRDWFAGQALVGVLAGQHPITREAEAAEKCAVAAYAIADAMLAEREKGRE